MINTAASPVQVLREHANECLELSARVTYAVESDQMKLNGIESIIIIIINGTVVLIALARALGTQVEQVRFDFDVIQDGFEAPDKYVMIVKVAIVVCKALSARCVYAKASSDVPTLLAGERTYRQETVSK